MLRRRNPPSPTARLISRIWGGSILLLLLAFSVWRINLYLRIKSQIAAIHAAGLPASPAELGAWLPKVADTNNGALLLTDAFTNLHEFKGRSPTLQDLTGLTRHDAWSAELRAAAERYVNTN